MPSSGIDSGVTARMVADEYGLRVCGSASSRRLSCVREGSCRPLPFLFRRFCLACSIGVARLLKRRVSWTKLAAYPLAESVYSPCVVL